AVPPREGEGGPPGRGRRLAVPPREGEGGPPGRGRRLAVPPREGEGALVRILVTNDDGIHAEGLAVLERIARRLSDDVVVCAPEAEQSGASRSLTLSEPLRVRTLGERRYAVRGTPTDCVMLAVQYLIDDGRPDLVLSGVNRGLN